MNVSALVASLAPSPTMAIDARAKALQAEGRDVVNFGAGEPDFETPRHIKDAAVTAIEQGMTRYTAVGGTLSLRRAIAGRIEAETGVHYNPDQILVSVGAKHSLFNALLALVNPGDKVLVPSPYWVSYPEQVKIAHGETVVVPLAAAEGFRLRAEDLERAYVPGVRGLILNSPSNPTGAVVDPREVARIAEWIRERDLWVLSDEIYHRLLYHGARHRSLIEEPDMQARTIYIDGVSKAYAMTGWRIGYAAGPLNVIQGMAKLQSQATSNPSSVSQAAAEVALGGAQDVVEDMRRQFSERRGVALSLLGGIPGFKPIAPQGAFYVFVDTAELAGARLRGRLIQDGDGLAELLLDHAGVAVVPGSGFGYPQGFRLSFATSRALIEEGIGRIASLVKEAQ